MTSFLTTRNIESEIENTIKNAQNHLILITPFLQINRMVLERLHDAARRNVQIIIVCRGKDLKEKEKEDITAVTGMELWFMDHLHAKCYANENQLILTSMNLYEASRKNREMGVLLTQHDDAYDDAMSEVHSILANSTQYKNKSRKTTIKKATKPKTQRKQSKSKAKTYTKKGFCIRCSTSIKHDQLKPFCKTCFVKWSKFKNEDYEETACHTCGTKGKKISFAKPQCYACWKK